MNTVGLEALAVITLFRLDTKKAAVASGPVERTVKDVRHRRLGWDDAHRTRVFSDDFMNADMEGPMTIVNGGPST
jgi:hypothetical protein